jgi:phage shock protein E
MLSFIKKLFSNNNDELKAVLNDHPFLVDVRSAAEFAMGNVKGSVNIPLQEIQNSITKFKNKKNIVVFCQSGMRSSQAKLLLQKNGFNNVFNGGNWNKVNNNISK